MVHLRIVSPADTTQRVVQLLEGSGSVASVVVFGGVARKPVGDVVLADVAREDASVIVDDLRELGLAERGSIAVGLIDTPISEAAQAAERHAPGLPSDAVVWEEVETRTEELTELSATFLGFMVLATLLAAIGIFLDQPILIIGAMVVGPEFGPLAGVCVAIVQRRGRLVRRSVRPLAVGFPCGVLAAILMTGLLNLTGLVPDSFNASDHPLTNFIAEPDFFSFLVAYLAGTAGVLSLTSAKSGALIGVLISVTTIPAAANSAIGVALGTWSVAGGALLQLVINVAAIIAAGVITLYLQRQWFERRRRSHAADPERAAAGLPASATPRAGKSGA